MFLLQRLTILVHNVLLLADSGAKCGPTLNNALFSLAQAGKSLRPDCHADNDRSTHHGRNGPHGRGHTPRTPIGQTTSWQSITVSLHPLGVHNIIDSNDAAPIAALQTVTKNLMR